jgi:hypothetical protein
MTYSHSQASLFADELTSSQDQPLANPSAKPESEKVQTMSGISFQSFFEWWQKSSHASLSLKTFMGCLVSNLDKYSRTITHHWKVKATPSKRYVFQLQPSMPRTDEIGCGLLLTPRTNEHVEDRERFVERNGDRTAGCFPNLATQVSSFLLTPSTVNIEPTGDRRAKRTAYRASVGRKDCPGGLAEQLQMLATPQAMDARSDVRRPEERSEAANKGGCSNLREQIAMLPTPQNRDYKQPDQPHQANFQRKVAEGYTIDLNSRVAMLLRSPSASDGEGGVMEIRPGADARYKLRDELPDLGKTTGQTLRLEPAFVEWMMGFPLNWTSLEAETTEFPD